MAVMVSKQQHNFVFSCFELDILMQVYTESCLVIFYVIQVKLDLSLLDDISDDIDFCFKLAKEESVIFLPGKK